MTTLINAPKLTTRLIAYRLDISTIEEAREYSELSAKLDSQGYKLFDCISMDRKARAVSGEVILDCSCLFDNQWNTTEDSPTNKKARVFDWYESIVPNKSLKIGHYLELTEEMVNIRQDVLKCGYCGHHEHKSTAPNFCTQCIDSEYLEESNLHLLRLVPVSMTWYNRPQLTEEESALLVPAFNKAKLHGVTERGIARIKKERETLKARAEKAIASATAERDGQLWLLDHSLSISNVIYYSHTGRFCFGWRQPVGDSLKSQLLEKLTEFPFDYDIK